MNTHEYMRKWLVETELWRMGDQSDAADGTPFHKLYYDFIQGKRPLELSRLGSGSVTNGKFIGYYAAPKEMKPGDPIPPLTTHPNKDWQRVEEFAELIRRQDYSNKPSRIGNVTIAATLEMAQMWGRQRVGLSDDPPRKIYEVGVEGKVVKLDATNLDVALDSLPSNWKDYRLSDSTLQRAVDNMRLYWNGNESIRRDESFLPEGEVVWTPSK